MFYLVIDLEMCRVPRDYRNKAYRYAYETIQIGAVLLNEEFKQVGTIREYVHPEHGVIDPFIEKLTGIKNSQVKKAPCIGEALVHMIDWIGENTKSMPGANPTEISFCMKSQQSRLRMRASMLL